MLNETLIQKLKQTNISVDTEKTRERVAEIWKSATNKAKQIVIDLAGVSRATVYRIYNTGSISAKLVVPIAQTLNVNPFYLIGEAEERGECSDELLKEFLTRYNYQDLLSEQARLARRSQKREKQASASQKAEEVPAPPCVCAEAQPADAGLPFPDDLTEDDMIILMKSILLRAKAGGKSAELAKQLKALLLS